RRAVGEAADGSDRGGAAPARQLARAPHGLRTDDPGNADAAPGLPFAQPGAQEARLAGFPGSEGAAPGDRIAPEAAGFPDRRDGRSGRRVATQAVASPAVARRSAIICSIANPATASACSRTKAEPSTVGVTRPE